MIFYTKFEIMELFKKKNQLGSFSIVFIILVAITYFLFRDAYVPFWSLESLKTVAFSVVFNILVSSGVMYKYIFKKY